MDYHKFDIRGKEIIFNKNQGTLTAGKTIKLSLDFEQLDSIDKEFTALIRNHGIDGPDSCIEILYKILAIENNCVTQSLIPFSIDSAINMRYVPFRRIPLWHDQNHYF